MFGVGTNSCNYGVVQCTCPETPPIPGVPPDGWRCSDPYDAGYFDTSGGPTEPIPTKNLEWVWVAFPDAKCRDGSVAGIEVNANSASDNLMIFLYGGGACWNEATCNGNPANFNHEGFNDSQGVFDRTNAANPVKDWNMVYVPYCTGDVHAGNNPGFDVPGVGPQQFDGYTNLQQFLGRIVPTFPNAKKLLYTGFSAGGFGTLLTVEMVAKKFPSSVDISYMDDSGPGMSNSFMQACLQKQNRTTWGFDSTFLEACGADCPDPDNFLLDYPKHLSKTYPSLRGGLIETVADGTITGFFGFGANDCNVDQTAFPPPMSPATFQAGLLDFRDQMTALVRDGGTPNFGTFYLAGTQHGWLPSVSLYTGSAGGTNLIDWFAGIVNGGAPTNVGP